MRRRGWWVMGGRGLAGGGARIRGMGFTGGRRAESQGRSQERGGAKDQVGGTVGPGTGKLKLGLGARRAQVIEDGIRGCWAGLEA